MPAPKYIYFFCKHYSLGMELLLFFRLLLWLVWYFQKQRYLITIKLSLSLSPYIYIYNKKSKDSTLNIIMERFFYAVKKTQRQYFPKILSLLRCSAALESWFYSLLQYVNRQLRWQPTGKQSQLKSCAIKCDFFLFLLIGVMCTLYMKWQPYINISFHILT